MLKTVAALAFLIFLCGCGGPAVKVTAEQGTPSHAMQTFIKAIMEGDVSTYLNSLDINARKQSMQVAVTHGPDFERIMKQQLVSFRSKYEGVCVTGEKITGNTAVVTLTGPDGTTVDMDFVKESDGWKLKMMK